MKFEFTGRHIEVTPAIKAHVKEQFENVRHLFDGKTIRAHVVIEVERGRHRAEIVLKWHSQILTAHATSGDMYLSLSKVVDKLERQVLKTKSKQIDKSHKAKKLSRLAAASSAKPRVKISVQKAYKVRTFAPEDAVAALGSAKSDFLLFRDAESGRVALVFKKKEGEFGLVYS
jgi:putative sigma-54 modulation protein